MVVWVLFVFLYQGGHGGYAVSNIASEAACERLGRAINKGPHSYAVSYECHPVAVVR